MLGINLDATIENLDDTSDLFIMVSDVYANEVCADRMYFAFKLASEIRDSYRRQGLCHSSEKAYEIYLNNIMFRDFSGLPQTILKGSKHCDVSLSVEVYVEVRQFRHTIMNTFF